MAKAAAALGLLSLAFIGVVDADDYFGSTFDYSQGDRVGTISKFSYKGIVWKTHEGQLSMNNFRATTEGGMSNTFEFSVRAEDTHIIDAIDAAQESGACVKLDYFQTLTSLPWEQETTYRITNVTELEPTACRGASLG